MEGWGGHCILPKSGTALFSDLWTADECQLHINVLELRAVCLTLLPLEQEVQGQTILIESDNKATVAYINKQEGVVSKTLNDEMNTLFQWLIPRSITVRAIHRPGVNNELANFLSHNCPDPTEWHLSERVVLQLFQLWSTPKVDLFTSHLNHQLPLWFCQTGHPVAVALDALSQSWTGLSLYAFPLIPLLERTLVKIREDQADEVIVIAPSWPR